jgi:hypothetical protein
MSTMADVKEVLEVTRKRITGVKVFPAAGRFAAIGYAQRELKSKGFTVGSMCEDCPIAAARGFDRVAKWYNLPRKDWSRIEALVISPDFREAGCTIIYLEESKGTH